MKSLKQVAIVMRGVDGKKWREYLSKGGEPLSTMRPMTFFLGIRTNLASLPATLNTIMADGTTHLDPTCESLAGKFTYLYLGTKTSKHRCVPMPQTFKRIHDPTLAKSP